MVAVEKPVARHPPHRSVLAELPHTVLPWVMTQNALTDKDAPVLVVADIDVPDAQIAPMSSCASGHVDATA